MDQALCAQVSRDIWQPKGSPLKIALRTCALCSVTHACLAFAIETDADGIWGGTTKEQRTKLHIEPLEQRTA